MPMFAVNSDAEFDEKILKSPDLVLAGFTADWCPHCKVLAPKMKEMASQMPELNLARVDTDKAFDSAEKFGIKTIPTLVFFKNGEKIASMSAAGVQDQEIMNFISSNLKAKA